MGFDPNKPITASNCPTRAALERGPDTPGFLKQSIGATHTKTKAERHRQNVLDRIARQKNK